MLLCTECAVQFIDIQTIHAYVETKNFPKTGVVEAMITSSIDLTHAVLKCRSQPKPKKRKTPSNQCLTYAEFEEQSYKINKLKTHLTLSIYNVH